MTQKHVNHHAQLKCLEIQPQELVSIALRRAQSVHQRLSAHNVLNLLSMLHQILFVTVIVIILISTITKANV